MKRLMLIATAVLFAACSPPADEVVSGDATNPAATDTAHTDTTETDTTRAGTNKVP